MGSDDKSEGGCRQCGRLGQFVAAHHWWIFAGLLLLALLVRLPHLGEAPYLRSTRPYIGLMQARYLYFQMEPPAARWRADVAADFFVTDPMLELPVQAAITAGLYRLTGGESVFIARAVPVLAWLAGAVFLFLLARHWLQPIGTLAACVFYLFSPFGIALSRLPQPDAAMTALLVGAWWAMVRRRDAAPARFLPLALFVFGATLVKPTCAPLVLVSGMMILHQETGRLRNMAGSRVLWLGVLVPMALASLYYFYRAGTSPGLGQQADMSFVPRLYGQWAYLSGWWERTGDAVGHIPLLCGLAAVFLHPDVSFRRFMLGLGLGYLAYGLVFNYHICTHDYYSLPLVAGVALGLGAGMQWLEQAAFARRSLAWGVPAVLVGLAVWSGIICWRAVNDPSDAGKEKGRVAGRLWGVNEAFLEVVYPGYGGAREKLAALREIGEIVKHNRHCLFLTRDYANSLNYHGEVSGFSWPLTSDLEGKRLRGHPAPSGVALLEQYRARVQPEYFIVTSLRELLHQKELMLHLGREHDLVAATDHYRIYRLKQAGLQEKKMPAGKAGFAEM